MRYLFTFVLCLPTAVMAQLASVSVPPVGVTRVDTPMSFSTARFDAPMVVGDASSSIRLAAENGTLTLANVQGLSFSAGDGQDDLALVFNGSAQDVNAALDGLIFTPDAGFAGRASITISGDEQSATWFVAVNRPIDATEARSTIMNGVTSIHGGVQPGHMVAFGQDAHDVAFYAEGFSGGTAVIAAGWGSGRVIAMPDHQMLNMHTYGEASGRLYRNGLTWLGGVGTGIRIVTLSAEIGGWLTNQGYQNVTVTNNAGLEAALANADVLVAAWLGSNVGDRLRERVANFVSGGGGLFICEYGAGYEWWWGKPIHEAPGNRILREAGIGFVGGNRWDNDVIDIVTADGEMSAERLLTMLSDPDQFAETDLERGGIMLGRIYDALSPEDPIAKRLDAAFGDAVEAVRPTPDQPVRSEWKKALLLGELDDLRALAPGDITKHRSADEIFGAVPDDAARISRTIRIDPAQTRWHSTGVYAPPGELISITVPEAVQGNGIVVRLGGHTDNIAVRPAWKRPPQVHWQYPLNANEVEAASPFGGAIYIDVGVANRETAPFELTINGAVEAPFFVLGETTDEDWVNGLRDAPAPYAELVSEHLAMSLPSNLIRRLANPTEVMTLWNDVVRLQDELGTHGARRHMAERINIDVQVSAGYLHAGYPTQGPVVAAPELVDTTHLQRTGSWGWFHELGHEAQRRPDKSWGWNNAYTFDGSVEATVNIFTVYAYDQLGLREQGGWGWTGAANTVMKRAIDGVDQGTYAEVGVGFKLAFFLQLRDHFGWLALRSVFELYNADGAMLPQGELAERDTWLLWTSQVMGHDLSRFVKEVWRIEVSDAAIAQLASLPEWMPAVGGIVGETLARPGLPLSLDLSGEALSHDGVADIVDVTAPENGTLVQEGERWVYTANADFLGRDQFSYGVRSSTGHVHTSVVDIEVSNAGVFMDTWFGISGNGISDLRNAPGFPDEPDESVVVQSTEAPNGRADNYGVRLRTYVVPPETDEYTFWIASDDNGELWMAPDDQWSNLSLVATVSAYTAPRDWTYSEEQRSRSISLRAGYVYALEALMKEGGGGDHLSVAWSRGSDEPSLIPSQYLFVDPPAPPPEPEPDMGMVEQDMGMIGSDMGAVEQDMSISGSDMGTPEPDGTVDVGAEQPQTDMDVVESDAMTALDVSGPEHDGGIGHGTDAMVNTDGGSDVAAPASKGSSCTFGSVHPNTPSVLWLMLFIFCLARRRSQGGA